MPDDEVVRVVLRQHDAPDGHAGRVEAAALGPFEGGVGVRQHPAPDDGVPTGKRHGHERHRPERVHLHAQRRPRPGRQRRPQAEVDRPEPDADVPGHPAPGRRVLGHGRRRERQANAQRPPPAPDLVLGRVEPGPGDGAPPRHHEAVADRPDAALGDPAREREEGREADVRERDPLPLRERRLVHDARPRLRGGRPGDEED